MLLLGILAAILLIRSLPAVPYNLRQLVADQPALALAIGYGVLLYAMALPPVLCARTLADKRPWLALPASLGCIVVQAGLAWLALESIAPAESLHDILGAPVLDWPGDRELALRFTALVSAPIAMAAVVAFLMTPARRRLRPAITAAGLIVLALPLWHWAVVARAATDNLTELMAGGGTWPATLTLWAWLGVVAFAATYLARSMALARPRGRALLITALSIPVAYGLLQVGTEQTVVKYGQVFSALQFLLSPDRAQLVSGPALFGLYALAHAVAVIAVALAQYPGWRWTSSGVERRSRPVETGRQAPARQASARTDDRHGRTGSLPLGSLTAAYALLIAYGTLFPLRGWQTSVHPTSAVPLLPWPADASLADVFTNVLVYLPLGALMGLMLRGRGVVAALVAAMLAGGGMSFLLESLQRFVPGRSPSMLDLTLNAAGALIGAALAVLLLGPNRVAATIHTWRIRWIQPGPAAGVGLAAAGLWLLAHASPLVPSLDLGLLREGLSPLQQAATVGRSFGIGACAAYTLEVAAFGVLIRSLAQPGRPVGPLFAVLVVGVTLAAVPLMDRQLTPEMLLGLAAGLALYGAGAPVQRALPLGSLAILAVAAHIVGALHPGPGAATAYQAFNWLPFAGHLTQPEHVLQSLGNVWPFVALAYVAARAERTDRLGTIAIGGLVVLALAAGLELAQTRVPGRYPDVTDVLLALAGWLIPWLAVPAAQSRPSSPAAAPRSRARAHTSVRWLSGLRPQPRWWGAGAVALVLVGGLIAIGNGVSRAPVGDGPKAGTDATFPAPEQLPPLDLPAFRYRHPRLPAPDVEDIRALRERNPRYLRTHRRLARQDRGNLYSKILTAYIEPGSNALDALHEELMGLELGGRGHAQVKPLSIAYDWLYRRWTPAQRERLRDRLIEGCRYVIGVIRDQRLSPYNVYLYNSPMQALMACSIAVYGEAPEAAPLMRFNHDMWKQRVLPVWRQVMGRHGGWHEGGEYIGIGVGQAVYQLPAMWRKATGEDLFATEPGLRGFLDFLVYRTRPDGTHFRWGDAGHFDRDVPDRIPLAIEYRHAAAYSLSPPSRVAPTAWPWGPLPDPSLHRPDSMKELPWAKLFDGLGLLVARSDWSDDATYVTFKAGDNYWSHSHLDQGAFTIYKGGPLAIDSGLYGPGYGADHHMNYTYQTIAHNTVTVTDPRDDAPAPPRNGEDEPRPIANDGGQRRVGSGWGLEPAPIDLTEWQAEREAYHTAEILESEISDRKVTLVANLTAAYTNDQSGPGSFSARTRRVERFVRTLIYDRRDDVVIVHDRVSATDAAYRKRWLLHTLERPTVNGRAFGVRVPPEPGGQGRAGGELRGHVLLPDEASIHRIGGPGFRFFLDERNYDADGEVLAIAAEPHRDVEPGAWRLEVSPSVSRRNDQFLVVMFPRGLEEADRPRRIRKLERQGRLGVEIRFRDHRRRWWLPSPG